VRGVHTCAAYEVSHVLPGADRTHVPPDAQQLAAWPGRTEDLQ
jgi:hypothetical protein